MYRIIAFISVLLIALPLTAQVQVEGSAGVGLAIPNNSMIAQVNGNVSMEGISSSFFSVPFYAMFMSEFLDGEVYKLNGPYNEKIKPNVSWNGSLSIRSNPNIPISLHGTYHRFHYSGLADLHFFPFSGAPEERFVTFLSSDIQLVDVAATIGYETSGPSKFSIHLGPLVQFQRLSSITHDLLIFQNTYSTPTTKLGLGFQAQVGLAQAINSRDHVAFTLGAHGASLNLAHPDDGFFNITPQVHVAYRHSFTKPKDETQPTVAPAEYFMEGVFSGCYGADPEREIDSLLNLVDSLGDELNDAVDEMEKNGFAKEVRAIESLGKIARISSSSGGLSRAVVQALGDYIKCDNAAMESLIRDGSGGAGQVIKGMKFLKDLLEFIAENNKNLTASEKKLIKKIVDEIGTQLDALEKALEDDNVEQAIEILKSIKEGLPDGWPSDLLERFAKNLLKEIEDAIADAGPKAAKKILEIILKKVTGSGAAAASLAEDLYNFVDLLYRLAVYYDALEEFNEAFVTLLEKLKQQEKGLDSGLTCHTSWGGQDERITKLVTEFELVCWCPEEPGSKTEGKWNSVSCDMDPSNATNSKQHTETIGSGSFGQKEYKVYFPADRPCDSDLCYLKHTVYGYDSDGNLIQSVSTFLGVAN